MSKDPKRGTVVHARAAELGNYAKNDMGLTPPQSLEALATAVAILIAAYPDRSRGVQLAEDVADQIVDSVRAYLMDA